MTPNLQHVQRRVTTPRTPVKGVEEVLWSINNKDITSIIDQRLNNWGDDKCLCVPTTNPSKEDRKLKALKERGR